ncbi:MAG: hypothetical protein IPH84_19140 [Bacteroidales bacterium]|nr:hypothetical protein [Bacteroidales bacterium]
MKTTGTSQWDSPNTGATNASGFSALPAGTLGSNGNWTGVHTFTLFWTTSEVVTTGDIAAASHELRNDAAQVGRYYHYKSDVMSVRCVRD